MIERYGKAAAEHASHAAINNWEHPIPRDYWLTVREWILFRTKKGKQQ
jgi:hypothetical protein